MCMSFDYMFLMVVIPGPFNPKRFIDVYLEPLIEELQNLWHVGILMHDNAKNETFMMRTMNYLPVYGIASAWSTTGIIVGIGDQKANWISGFGNYSSDLYSSNISR
ncbi:UNVERIFIED_CONTAM: hypothetical protein Sindi_2692500 [Sesamum indicum]